MSNLKVKLFADGANLADMCELYRKPFIQGFTTNPTLMRKAGITDYEAFAREVVRAIPDRPISFEVFSDDFPEMERQALKIASWGDNVYAKIPVTNTLGHSAAPLVRCLSRKGVKLNVTALTTIEQVQEVGHALTHSQASFVSVFAGRVADTGRDPVPLIRQALDVLSENPGAELIWASPRELFNVFQADALGCHVITVTGEILGKLSLIGKDPCLCSLETIKMFREDAVAAGFTIA